MGGNKAACGHSGAKQKLTAANLQRHNSATYDQADSGEDGVGDMPVQPSLGASSRGGGSCRRQPVLKKASRGAFAGCACEVCGAKCKTDCSNWASARREGQRRAPVKFLCLRCSDFSDASGISVKALSSMRNYTRQSVYFEEQILEYESNTSNPDQREYDLEEVCDETKTTIGLMDSYEFRPRKHFLMTVVVILTRPGCSRYLRPTPSTRQSLASLCISLVRPGSLTWTEKTSVRNTYLMRPSQHLFKRQGECLYNSAVAKAATTLGQEHGGKYKPPHKEVTVYTPVEVQDLVNQARLRMRGDDEETGALADVVGSGGGAAATSGACAQLLRSKVCADDLDSDAVREATAAQDEDESRVTPHLGKRSSDFAQASPAKSIRSAAFAEQLSPAHASAALRRGNRTQYLDTLSNACGNNAEQSMNMARAQPPLFDGCYFVGCLVRMEELEQTYWLRESLRAAERSLIPF